MGDNRGGGDRTGLGSVSCGGKRDCLGDIGDLTPSKGKNFLVGLRGESSVPRGESNCLGDIICRGELGWDGGGGDFKGRVGDFKGLDS